MCKATGKAVRFCKCVLLCGTKAGEIEARMKVQPGDEVVVESGEVIVVKPRGKKTHE